MANFAKLDENNIVIDVNVVSNNVLTDDEEASGLAYLTEWSGGHTNWKQTSYNNNFRKQFAGIGYKYDPINNIFIAPRPYPSWSLDNNFDWQPPIPMPIEGLWNWNEQIGDWVEAVAQ
jgi:hypothetical protein